MVATRLSRRRMASFSSFNSAPLTISSHCTPPRKVHEDDVAGLALKVPSDNAPKDGHRNQERQQLPIAIEDLPTLTSGDRGSSAFRSISVVRRGTPSVASVRSDSRLRKS